MRLSKKFVFKVFLVSLIMLILLSALQWAAFYKAKETAESLPCDDRLEVYQLEVTSFLPPKDILEKAVGYSGTYGDRTVVIVEGRYGHRSWWYETYLNSSRNRLNNLVTELRDVLNNGSSEEIGERFWALEVEYFALKAIRDYGRNNLTKVVFRPSPPLSTLLFLKNFVLESRNVLIAPLVSLIITGAMLLWLILVGKVRISSDPAKFVLALVLALLVFLPTVEGLVYLLKHSIQEENPYSGQTGKCGLLRLHPDYNDFWNMAVDHIREDDHKASCEVLEFLSRKLTENQMSSLGKTLNITCP